MATAVSIQCAVKKQVAGATQEYVHTIYRIELRDSIFINKGSTHDGHVGFLQTTSRIKGNDYVDRHGNHFSIGLIDFDGDSTFNSIDQDRFFLSIFGNRSIKINNGYGVPIDKIKNKNYFQVDSIFYSIKKIDEQGAYIDIIEQIIKPPQGTSIVNLKPSIEDTVFQDYSGNKKYLKQLIGDKKYAYIYFWVSRPFEDGLSMLQNIHENSPKNDLVIIGMHPAFADLDIDAYKNDFFAALARPWPQLICPKSFYMSINQDLSWYSGILVDRDLNILKIYVSPIDIFNWIDQR